MAHHRRTCALEIHPSNAFSFSFTADGHKAVDVVCTDSVERNHWYRAIADVIERKVSEKEGQRREHNQRVEQVMDEQVVRSLHATLTQPHAPLHLPSPLAEWKAGGALEAVSVVEARDDPAAVVSVQVVEDGESEEEEEAPPLITTAGKRYSYADSDEEDFSPQPPPLSKDDDEEQKQPLPPATRPSPPVPSPFLKHPTPSPPAPHPTRPTPHTPFHPAHPPRSPTSESGDDDEDDDDGCYDPLFHSLSTTLPHHSPPTPASPTTRSAHNLTAVPSAPSERTSPSSPRARAAAVERCCSRPASRRWGGGLARSPRVSCLLL